MTQAVWPDRAATAMAAIDSQVMTQVHSGARRCREPCTDALCCDTQEPPHNEERHATLAGLTVTTATTALH